MTTILVDCKAQKIYADRQVTELVDCPHRGQFYGVERESIKKLHINESSGVVIAGAGSVSAIEEFVKLYPEVGTMYRTEPQSASIFVVKALKKGVRVVEYEYKKVTTSFWNSSWFGLFDKYPYGVVYLPTVVGHYSKGVDCLTLGSGEDIARFLFREGHSVKDIFEMASRFDSGTGYDYDTVDLKDLAK
jgi:hypothetical protein